MVHSFKQVDNANGNTTIEFYEDTKKRQIIIQKNTQAQLDFKWVSINKTDLQQAINELRKKYKFIANPNNKSIFRPVARA